MADPIHALVFSKDRAMQLDAFLRSAAAHSPYASIDVLYTASSPDHLAAYMACVAEHPPGFVGFEYEGNEGLTFAESVALTCDLHDRIVFHTDDEVFFRTPPLALLDNETDVITLRQGRNTVYCHPLDREQKIPDTFPRWRWRDAELDFAYPLSLNACVYNADWILPLLNFPFANPTELEHGLACQHMTFPVEWMVAPDRSCTVALPHNRVSASSGCPAGANPGWQPDALCAKFLDGWRIDVEAMDFTNVNAAHVEVPLKFYRPEA